MILPPALALFGLCSINFAAHGRFAVSPFGNIFLLARVIYDGPGMAVLRRDCPTAAWRLCPFLGIFPPTSDEFLWKQNSPLNQAGGPKAVSRGRRRDYPGRPDLRSGRRGQGCTLKHLGAASPVREWRRPVPLARASLRRNNTRFPCARSRLVRIRQATGRSIVGASGARTSPHGRSRSRGHGVLASASHRLLRRAPCAGFLVAVLITLPVSAAITGALSTPHDRYQSRIMWLPPFIAVISLASLRHSDLGYYRPRQ